MYCKLIIIIVITFIFSLSAGNVAADETSIDIALDPGRIISQPGTASPEEIKVKKGDKVTLNFTLPLDDNYCCGMDVKAGSGEFESVKIQRGKAAKAEFIAENSFIYYASWVNTGTPRVTGLITVEDEVLTEISPPEVSSTTTGTSQIDITWKAVRGAKAYEIYRDKKLLTTTRNLWYEDSELSRGTTYTYTVVALNGDLKSTESNQSSATTHTERRPPEGIPGSGDAEGGSSESGSPDEGVTVQDVEAFVDTRYNLIEVEGTIYGFYSLNDIARGDKMKVYGRTVANASIEVKIIPASNTYTTRTNANGFWQVDIDTTDIKLGSNTFRTTISADPPINTQSEPLIAFTIIEKPVEDQPDEDITITDLFNPDQSNLSTAKREKVRNYGLMLAIGGIALIFISILMLIIGKVLVKKR